MSDTQQAQALESSTPDSGGRDSSPDTAPEAGRTFRADREGRASRTRSGRKEAIEKAAQIGTKTTTVDGVPAEAANAPEWKEPGYFNRWNDKSKAAAKFLANHPEMRAHWGDVQAQIDDIYKFNGRTENELGMWRQLAPVRDMLAPYEQHWRMSGMSVPQGLGQLLAYQDALSRDPDATLPQLAAMFKPRDAAKVLQALSSAWGTDLGTVANGQPYIDPAISGMVNPLVAEIAALKRANSEREQHAQNAQMNHLLQQINAFESATDDKGAPKHPLFREMFAEMVAYANAQRMQGQPVNIEQVYKTVFSYHPAAAAARAKEAERVAMAAASQTNAATREATEASRNVSGGRTPRGQSGKAMTLQEAMRQADKELGNR